MLQKQCAWVLHHAGGSTSMKRANRPHRQRMRREVAALNLRQRLELRNTSIFLSRGRAINDADHTRMEKELATLVSRL